MDQAAVPRPRTTVAIARSEDRVTLLDLDHLDRPAHILEGTAASIWEAADGTRAVTEVVAALAQAYDVAPAAIEADVVGLLDQLVELGLLEG